MNKKRIAIFSPFFFPEAISTGKYNSYLAQQLQQEGHDVHVITSFPLYPNWRPTFTRNGLPGINILRGGKRIYYPQSAILRRLILELWFLFHSCRQSYSIRNEIDIIVFIFPPTLFSLLVCTIFPKSVKKTGIIHDIQGIMANTTKSPIRRITALALKTLEKLSYRRCDQLICLSESMKSALIDIYSTPPFKCSIKYPFITHNTEGVSNSLKDIFPENQTHVVYSGALGEKQCPELLLEVFKNLTTSSNDVACHLFSAGAIFRKLQKKYQNSKRINFHPLVEEEYLLELYKRSDIQILPQAPGTGDGAFPSKLPNILAAGTPIFAICEEKSEVSRVIRKLNAGQVGTSFDARTLSREILNKISDVKNKPGYADDPQIRKSIHEMFSLDSLSKLITEP